MSAKNARPVSSAWEQVKDGIGWRLSLPACDGAATMRVFWPKNQDRPAQWMWLVETARGGHMPSLLAKIVDNEPGRARSSKARRWKLKTMKVPSRCASSAMVNLREDDFSTRSFKTRRAACRALVEYLQEAVPQYLSGMRSEGKAIEKMQAEQARLKEEKRLRLRRSAAALEAMEAKLPGIARPAGRGQAETTLRDRGGVWVLANVFVSDEEIKPFEVARALSETDENEGGRL